jgi:putative effector of murein hydrolase LrgA (UPF0299 family)
MNIKFKAVLQTIAFFAVTFISATLAHYLPVYVVGGIAFAGLFYLVYTLLLSRLEFDKKIEDISIK